MKRLSIISLFLVSVFAVQAANFEKECRKLIEIYDVSDSARMITSGSTADFWTAVLDGNELLIKFNKDITKNRGAEKEAIEKTAQLPRFYPQYDESIIRGMQGYCDTLLANMGISDLPVNCSLHVVYSDDVNAFTTLTEDGFSICLTSALLEKRGVTYDILKGYVAHEFVHGALLHHIRGFYQTAKQRRKNDIIAGVAAGLSLVAVGAIAAVADDSYPNNYYPDPEVNINITNEVKIPTREYNYAYLPEQEYEADLVAFRFLESMDRGDDYINGLRILGADYDRFYDENSDHPTITARIDFLKFVQQNPELGNTNNVKMRVKRYKKMKK